MGRPRGPEDGKPKEAPCYPEDGGASRYELPVTVAYVKGLLVVRVFADRDDPHVSIRGQAVELLRRMGR